MLMDEVPSNICAQLICKNRFDVKAIIPLLANPLPHKTLSDVRTNRE